MRNGLPVTITVKDVVRAFLGDRTTCAKAQRHKTSWPVSGPDNSQEVVYN